MMNLFKKTPSPIAAKVDELTAAAQQVLSGDEALALRQTVEVTADGGTQVINAIRHRLKNKDPIIQKFALDLLEILMQSPTVQVACANSVALSKMLKLFTSTEFAPENKRRLADMIALWVYTHFHVYNPPFIDRSSASAPPQAQTICDPTISPPLNNAVRWLVNCGYIQHPFPVAYQAPHLPNQMFFSDHPTSVPFITAQQLSGTVPIQPRVYPNAPVLHQTAPMPWVPAQSFATYAYPTTVSAVNHGAALQQDIDMAQNNLEMFNEAMAFITPGKDIESHEVLQEFKSRCTTINQSLLARLQNIDNMPPNMVESLLAIQGRVAKALDDYEELKEAHLIEKAIQTSQTPELSHRQRHKGIVIREPVDSANEPSPFDDPRYIIHEPAAGPSADPDLISVEPPLSEKKMVYS
ncbi:hypothetical protein BC832DRAFT_540287 [Gaertneriomyces semiglobifer]|nr:hypothetical protein BC832DRAFT_540287 [Gaertneriomyces semiglobifer]